MAPHHSFAMMLSVAAIVLCGAGLVSSFATPARNMMGVQPVQPGWTISGPRSSRWRHRSSSMTCDKGRSSFDPLGFSSSERRRGGAKLQAIKIGMEKVDDLVHPEAALLDEEGVDSSGGGKVSPPDSGWEYWKWRALLAGVAFLWATNFPSVKFVETAGVPSASAAFVRFAIAAASAVPLIDFKQTEVLLAGMEIGGWVALGYLTQAIGLQTTDASVCAFLCSLTVVVVPLVDAITGKGIKRVTVAASLLALLGTGFLELGDAHASLNDLWCVAQAIGFGVAFTRIEHYMEKFPGKSLQLSIGQLISVAGFTGLWCAYSAGGHLPDFSFIKDPPIAAALAYTGLITTSLAIWLETICLEKVPAAEMSVIFSTEPLWATLVSGVFLKETMGPNALVGAGVILLACLVAQSEQIVQLLGKDGSESEEDEPLDISDTDDGVDDTPMTVVEREDLPLSVLDEIDPAVESPIEVSKAEEYTVPMGIYVEGSPLTDMETGDVPAVRLGWFGSMGQHEQSV